MPVVTSLAHRVWNAFKRARSAFLDGGAQFFLRMYLPFYRARKFRYSMDDLRQMPPSTVGYAVARALDAHGLEITKGYEQHDIRHVLLGYDMVAEGEGSLQFFKLGNGHFKLPVFVAIIACAAVMPDQWPTFWEDMQRGKRAASIARLDNEAIVTEDLQAARARLNLC